jgi:hypothetical protein
MVDVRVITSVMLKKTSNVTSVIVRSMVATQRGDRLHLALRLAAPVSKLDSACARILHLNMAANIAWARPLKWNNVTLTHAQ